MYNVYQHWDPLKVCIVGRSYNPEFYEFITNTRTRNILERIARETEEDYQKLIKLLESFGVTILRPTVSNNYRDYLNSDGKIKPPPMNPRDYSIMIGNTFYFNTKNVETPFINVINDITKHSNLVLDKKFAGCTTTRIGKDLYFGTHEWHGNPTVIQKSLQQIFNDYRCHVINTTGHTDSVFNPVVPGLIVSLLDIPTYSDTFPGWEVIYLPHQGWNKITPFLELKKKNKGKWWVPGEEFNDDFTNFVEEWLDHWVGYVEETVFDVNMLVIDKKNVVCNGYNKDVFDAFARYGITPHIINFRHRYFWDGGLHCITSDVHRIGTMEDYFPERI
jgi:N-dimethylarginine dimethylaminohydrolase